MSLTDKVQWFVTMIVDKMHVKMSTESNVCKESAYTHVYVYMHNDNWVVFLFENWWIMCLNHIRVTYLCLCIIAIKLFPI